MKRFILISVLLLGTLTCALVSGCADSVSSNNDKVPPSISVYSPLTDSIVTYGKTYISYDVSDDQGVGYVDVYAYSSSDNTLLYSGRFTFTSNTKPQVYFNLDSAKSVGKYIYYFMIAADKSGNLKYSDTLSHIYVAKSVKSPSAPFGLKITRLRNSKILNISWSDTSNGVTQYLVERSIATNSSFVVIQTLPGNYFNCNDNNIDTTQRYYYRIRSRNDIGYSDYSNIVGYLPAPINLTVTALSATKDSLSWKNSMVGNYIQIERMSNNNFVTIANLSPTETYYIDAANLSAQGKYYYRVKVFSGSDSTWSDSVSITMPAFDIPAPTSLKASVQTDTVKNSKYIHLSWKETSNQIETTDVERSDGNASNYSVIGQFAGYNISKTYTFDDTTAVKGVAYFYRVRARSDTYSINSPYSDAVTVAIPSPRVKAGLGKK